MNKTNLHINQKLYNLNIQPPRCLIVGVIRMFDLTQKQHQLSLAYIHAVTSYAGCEWQKSDDSTDLFKIDGRIKGRIDFIEGVIKDTQPELRIQAKSTRQARHQPKEGDPYIHYSLDKETYEELRSSHHELILFVLFVLPEDSNQWINHSETELISRKCAYWHSIKGCPKNDSDKTIRISRTHLFSPDQVKDLIYKVAKKEQEDIPNGCD
jgi:hypothetical protein